MRILVKYLHHLLVAKTKHGVHSPFVYQLMTETFSNKNLEKQGINLIEAYRKDLKRNTDTIDFHEFGAGSRINNNKEKRSVREIVSSSSKPARQAKVLHRFISQFSFKEVIELGTSFGISTMYLASGNPNCSIQTIEGNKSVGLMAQKQAQKRGYDNITFHYGTIDEQLPIILKRLDKVDLVFFDGNHRKEPTWKYFNACLNNKHEETVFIFDDIYWSKEMEEVWKDIKNHPEVTLTIDTFDFGFAFFRQNREKEHFKIRI